MMSILERRKAKASNLFLTAPIAALAVSGITATKSIAAAIGASDLLVYQSGTSTVADAAGGSTLTIDDFNTTSNTISQTWNVTNLTGDSSSSSGTTLYSNSNGSNGQLALSDGGTEVTFGGYQGYNSSNELAQPIRQAAYLTADGTFTTAATYTESSGGQVRSAYTPDGTNPNYLFTDKVGIYGPSGQLNTTNSRYLAGFGGIDFVSAQGSGDTNSLFTYSGGTTTAVTLPSGITTGSITDFDLLQSGLNGSTYDTLYIADSTSIYKYAVAYSSGTPSLTAEGSFAITAATGTTGKAADLVGVETSSGVDLYFTTTSNSNDPGSLEEVVDTAAYDSAFTPSSGMPTVLYNAPTGVDLFGVETAPVAVPEPASIGLLACGLGLMARRSRRRQVKA